MELFLALGAMTVAALALVAVPLLRRHRAVAPRAGYDVEVYRDQLRELDVDLERGVIPAEERDTARLEIERRILAASPADEVPEASAPDTTHLITAFAVVVVLPLVAGSLYLWLGAPGAGDQPIATRDRNPTPTVTAVPEGDMPDVEQMVIGLAERLKAQPNDLDGWIMLGRSYSVLERFDEAVTALKHAEMMAKGDPNVTAMLGEFQVFAAGGVVTPEAKAAFGDALARDGGHPAARFYLALAKRQVGDARGALDDWVALLRDSDPAAPWLPVLHQRIEETRRPARRRRRRPAACSARSTGNAIRAAAGTERRGGRRRRRDVGGRPERDDPRHGRPPRRAARGRARRSGWLDASRAFLRRAGRAAKVARRLCPGRRAVARRSGHPGKLCERDHDGAARGTPPYRWKPSSSCAALPPSTPRTLRRFGCSAAPRPRAAIWTPRAACGGGCSRCCRRVATTMPPCKARSSRLAPHRQAVKGDSAWLIGNSTTF